MHYSADDLWKSLPTDMAPLLRSQEPRLTEMIVAEIQQRIPEFARPQEPYVRAIRVGVERALAEFNDRIAEGRGPRPWDPEAAEVYRALGRGEAREGRSLDAIQSAYRLGARLGWQSLVQAGERMGVPPDRMYRLAEALFAYIDELADQTLEGYTEARASLAGELQRRRQRLLDLLTAAAPPSMEAAAALARTARWPLPETVRAVALRAARPGEEPPSPVLPGIDALVDTEGPEPCMLMADPGPRVRALLARALHGWTAAVGPPVRVTDAGVSLRWARRLLALGARGFGDGSAVLHCSDHLSALVLLQDEVLIRALAARRLAPLDGLTSRQRDRMAETLLCWLECGGSAPEVARMLQVHPQTVRYRLRQIEELFGDGLRDPDVRFELELALRAHRLLAGLHGSAPGGSAPGGSGSGGPAPGGSTATGSGAGGSGPGGSGSGGKGAAAGGAAAPKGAQPRVVAARVVPPVRLQPVVHRPARP